VGAARDAGSLERLSALWSELQTAHRDGETEQFLDLHWDFHRAICVEAGNPFLTQSWNTVSNLIRLHHHMSVGAVIEEAAVLRNDLAFLDALKTSEPADAEALLRSQIIRMAYQLLERPCPPGVIGYIDRYVSENGDVLMFPSKP
jgi:DNA-binding GntR family transcriptional regulator